MLSKFVSIGDKIELQVVNKEMDDPVLVERKVYRSEVYDILSEEKLEIAMPMEKSRMILLSRDVEYELFIYCESGLYQCNVQIEDRYKSDNVYALVVELTSNLQKHQRREFYRFNCAIEMHFRLLSEKEIQLVEKNSSYTLKAEESMNTAIIVDISGGGVRFVSKEKMEIESLLYCSYCLKRYENDKIHEVIGKVIAVQEVEKHPGLYEHRLQYYKIEKNKQEEIIKYIFEEERKERKKERFL